MAEGRKKIMIVDDELGKDLLIQLLEDDYDLCTGGNMAQSLETVRKERPDMLLTELTLPLLNGWDLVDRIRDMEEGKNMTVIAVTAAGMPDDEERAREVGCNEFVLKPINDEALLLRIEELLGG